MAFLVDSSLAFLISTATFCLNWLTFSMCPLNFILSVWFSFFSVVSSSLAFAASSADDGADGDAASSPAAAACDAIIVSNLDLRYSIS